MNFRHIFVGVCLLTSVCVGLLFLVNQEVPELSFEQPKIVSTQLQSDIVPTLVAFNSEAVGLDNPFNDDEPIPAKYSNASFGDPAGLPRPSTLSIHKFEEHLFQFVHERKYQELGWSVDKTIRDTGPYINKRAYGTHPAVRVYYSPEVMKWLVGGRKGMIPDGAMMIKEQYPEPAIQHVEKSESELRESLKSWTVMVKDSKGSHDGWFWSNPYANNANPGREPLPVNNHKYPYNHPESGFGHYCIRCHSSTQSPGIETPSENNEFTFAALRNIKGFPGEPIIFRVDDSWREIHKLTKSDEPIVDPENEKKIAAKLEESAKESESSSHPKCTGLDFPEQCDLAVNKSFLETFNQIPLQQKRRHSPHPTSYTRLGSQRC